MGLVADVSELYTYREVLSNFIKQDLKLRYRRSVLGFLWSLLYPLLNIAVLAVVFSQLMKFSTENYVLYLVAGLVPWSFFANSLLNAANSFITNEGFIKKIYLPKLIFPVAGVAGCFYDFVFALVSLFFLVSLLHFNPSWALLALPGAVLLLALFALGLGITVAVVNVYYRDTAHLLSVLLQILFYLTPIIYPRRIVPERFQFVVDLNPMYHVIRLFQVILNEGRFPTALEWGTAVAVSLTGLMFGYWIFKRLEKRLIFRL